MAVKTAFVSPKPDDTLRPSFEDARPQEDDPAKVSPKERVERAVLDKRRADYLALCSKDAFERGDMVGGRAYERMAKDKSEQASDGLSHWSYTTRNPQRGNGGELVPLPDKTPAGACRRDYKVSKVTEPMDVLAHQASSERMDMLIGVDALSIGIHLSEVMKPKNELQRMLLHQIAATQALAMTLAGKAHQETKRINEASVFHQDPRTDARRQIACIEAARLTNASARMFAAANDAMMAFQKLKTGGKQVVQVQHVVVKDGGQAVVGQNIQSGKKTGKGGAPKSRGRVLK